MEMPLTSVAVPGLDHAPTTHGRLLAWVQEAVANETLDIPALFVALPVDFRFVAKKVLKYVPITGWYTFGNETGIERHDRAPEHFRPRPLHERAVGQVSQCRIEARREDTPTPDGAHVAEHYPRTVCANPLGSAWVLRVETQPRAGAEFDDVADRHRDTALGNLLRDHPCVCVAQRRNDEYHDQTSIP